MISKRITIVGKRLAALRRARYLTQEEFALSLQMSSANVRRLEQADASGMQMKNFRRLASVLELEPDELRRRIGAVVYEREMIAEGGSPVLEVQDPGLPPSAIKESYILTDVVDVPHFHGVSAARIDSRSDLRRGRAPAPAGPGRRFAVTLDGDCMQPRYCDGDVVLFCVDSAEREGIIDGRNYFIQFTDGDTTFKRVFLDPDHRETLILRCWNPNYAERMVDRSSVKLLARAIYRLTPDE